MKILHTSDWHLGKNLFEKSLIEDQKYIFTEIINIIEKDPHDVMIIAGDIYDRSIPSAEAINLLSWFLSELRKVSDITIIFISGNHDSATRLSYCSELIAISNIHFCTETDNIDKPIEILKNDIKFNFYSMPFLYPTSFTENQEEKFTHESAVKIAIEKIKSKLNRNDKNILIAHLLTLGGVNSDSERKLIGTAGEVDSKLFQLFDYTALGHLHKPQQISDNIIYSGSILKYSFSESDDIKHMVSIEMNDKKIVINNIELKPLKDMIRLKGKFSELLNSNDFIQYKDDYIEAEITDKDLVINPFSILKSRFDNLLSVIQKKEDQESKSLNIEILNRERNILDDFKYFESFLYDEEIENEKLKKFKNILEKELIDETT